jgi:hypothetical protein
MEMVPFTEVVPVIVEPVKATIHPGCGQVFNRPAGSLQVGHEEREKGCRIPVGVRQLAEGDAVQGRHGILDDGLVAPLGFQDPVQFSQLGQPHGRIEFTDPVVGTDEQVVFGAPVIADVVMPVVGMGMGGVVDRPVVGDHGTAFAAGDGFHRVE